MDGSPGGYYHATATATSSSSWILALKGGGECADKANCDSRHYSALGNSKFFPKDATLTFLLQDDPVANPRLHAFNRVHIPYCSQDFWTGQRIATSNETFGYYFSGHHILASVLDALDPAGLSNASEIILTGESAGGIGVWPHLDWLAARYPKARVTGAPLAGYYFFAVPYTGHGHTSSSLADFREAAWPGHFELWNSTIDGAAQLLLSRGAACSVTTLSRTSIRRPSSWRRRPIRYSSRHTTGCLAQRIPIGASPSESTLRSGATT